MQYDALSTLLFYPILYAIVFKVNDHGNLNTKPGKLADMLMTWLYLAVTKMKRGNIHRSGRIDKEAWIVNKPG